jgi:hypothetical protein
MAERPTIVVSRHWHEPRSELSFVTRAVAGAASRNGPTPVVVLGPAGAVAPDGAFDTVGMGHDGSLSWPADVPAEGRVIVDELTPELHGLLGRVGAESGLYVSRPHEGPAYQTWRKIRLVGDDAIGLFVPVHPLAASHRHHGFGFTGYVLVLSDRAGHHVDPPAAVHWLTSALHDQWIVLVESAVASAWKGRSLRGTTSVDTRMDLWRLVAHAGVCIDLAPGQIIARECVEALRLGTPIVVPEEAEVAASHARASGGTTFADWWEMLAGVDATGSAAHRSSAVTQGRTYADTRFGDPGGFVDRLAQELRHPA